MSRPPGDRAQLGFDLGDGEPRNGPRPPSPPPPSQPPPRTDELPDARARARIATDLETNLLVEAGAGSGKTTALVSRMVALVREGVARVTDIAAVTFTRKAAGELRERFQEALERERSRADVSRETRDRLELALQELDRAFMGTIHAFCARLLRERPLEAGIDPAFSETTAMEANRLAARYWTLHLERLAAAGDAVLAELDAVGLTPLDLKTLYDDLRENLDVDFPLELAPLPDPAEVREARDAMNRILDAAERFPGTEGEQEWDELRKRLRSVGYVRRFRRWDDDRVFLDALAEICSRKKWEVTQKRWAADKAGKQAAVDIERLVNHLCATEGQARRLLEAWWAHRYDVAMRFALGAARGLQEHRRSTGQLDFQDLLSLSAKLLRESPSARRDLGRRYGRLLVDEFQDTDPLQAEVVFLLASDPGSDAGDWTRSVPRPGALFVVGDPKQSIYRFRRADIALYMQVRGRFAELGDVLLLNTNFRSGHPIAALVNSVFAPELGFPAHGSDDQAAFAALLPAPGRDARESEGVFAYTVAPERTNDAMARWDASALAYWVHTRIASGERRPEDFLILTRKKYELQHYARALEALEVPVQVSGSGPDVGVEEMLSELTLLLEALLDPDDPSLTVAVLIGAFFGLDHEQLLLHAESGRSFDLRRAGTAAGQGPDATSTHTSAVEAALLQLQRWWEISRTEAADVLVTRVAAELGLLAHAAAGELGSIRSGAIAFLLDAVRAAGSTGDTSLRGALDALAQATEDDEAEAPLEPGRSDALRLMNLHKAKGLEAPVVILAGPFGERDKEPQRHIERTPEGRARGWLSVERRDGWTKRVLAQPRGWDAKLEAEERFAKAEAVRLLYVAATRAGEEVVVARRADKAERSPWFGLDSWLALNATRLDLAPTAPPPRQHLDVSAVEMLERVAEAARRRAGAAPATYEFRSVTAVAKGVETPPVSLSPSSGLEPLDPADGPSGLAWGSAVHGVLEAAAHGASPENLRTVARTLLLDLERPVRNGEPTELHLLMDTARGVIESPLWERSRASGHALAEVPFALERTEGAPQTYVEGVIDLAFREDDGWVVVDYKTDRTHAPDFESRRAQYREQLRIYADAWARLTGEPVKERLLWFVRSREVEAVS